LLGNTSNGWAFAIASPAARDRADRLAPGRDMRSEQTVVNIWYSTDHTDHSPTRRLVAEAGLVLPSDDIDGDEEFDEVAMADVYRIMGEHYGLALPRQAITDRHLPHLFTELRVFVRHRCGAQSAVSR
jgi:hypothetical protein